MIQPDCFWQPLLENLVTSCGKLLLSSYGRAFCLVRGPWGAPLAELPQGALCACGVCWAHGAWPPHVPQSSSRPAGRHVLECHSAAITANQRGEKRRPRLVRVMLDLGYTGARESLFKNCIIERFSGIRQSCASSLASQSSSSWAACHS